MNRTLTAAVLSLALAGSVFVPAMAIAQGTPQTLALSQVSTQALATGFRASKIIDESVYNETDYELASVHDLIITPTGEDFAVLSVGSTLGLGGKLVVVPFKALTLVNKKIVMNGVTEEGLKALPEFTYKE